MAASLTNPFLGAPYASAESLHSPSLLPSPNIIHLPARRSQLKRLGLTIGSPIEVYSETSQACRPSRAYCLRSMQGGGIYVDREIAGKVIDGVSCLDILKSCEGIDILAYVSQVHKVVLPEGLVDHETLTYDQIKGSIIRCPNPEYAEKMIAEIEAVRVRGDSFGGKVTCIARNLPRSHGSRAFREIIEVLAEGAMSLPATEGFEIGNGFTGTFWTGSEYSAGQSGGIEGWTSNPKTIKMRIAFKSMIRMRMKELDFCAVPRAVHLVETVVAQLLFPMMIYPTYAAPHEPLE
ncbi:chorismate synthase 1, chloroplastic-like isoform X2 [Primulina eburnea]|uniref:chorismate synthase 1, chloroplastic-like isoform X2 n=1 Tax=Primulina eburnea TaxID=1245227 RepID=UPI003C6CC07F